MAKQKYNPPYQHGYTTIRIPKNDLENFQEFKEFIGPYAIDIMGELWIMIDRDAHYVCYSPIEPLVPPGKSKGH